MKKFLLFATAVGAAFTSCVNENEAVLPSEENPQIITFEVAKYKPSSRAEDTQTYAAADTTYEFSTKKTFGTFGYKQKNNETGHTKYMDNIEIRYYAAATPYWAAKENPNSYMWESDSHIDFISYAPYSPYGENNSLPASVPIITDDNEGNSEALLKYVNFEVKEDSIDLLYSDKAVHQTHNTNHYFFTGVPTLFHHALAKLNFKAKVTEINNKTSIAEGESPTYWQVTLNSIKISNIYNKGNVEFTLTSTNHTTNNTTVGWKNKRDVDNYNVWTFDASSKIEKTWSVKDGVILTTEPVIYGEAKDYFILPQAIIGQGQSITIDFDVQTKTSENGNWSEKNNSVKTVIFSDYTSVPAWEIGKNITYTIQIDPAGDVIHFDPAVMNWDDITGTIDI